MNRLNGRAGPPAALMVLLLAAGLSGVQPAKLPAQDSPGGGSTPAGVPHLQLEIMAELQVEVTKDDGTTAMRLVPMGETVESGDIIVYTIAYVNAGPVEAKDAANVDPVPKGTVFIGGTATGDGTEITFSVDGGTTYHTPPLVTRRVQPDGTRKSVPVPPGQYTHVRWLITEPVLPGQTGQVGFKVRVE